MPVALQVCDARRRARGGHRSSRPQAEQHLHSQRRRGRRRRRRGVVCAARLGPRRAARTRQGARLRRRACEGRKRASPIPTSRSGPWPIRRLNRKAGWRSIIAATSSRSRRVVRVPGWPGAPALEPPSSGTAMARHGPRSDWRHLSPEAWRLVIESPAPVPHDRFGNARGSSGPASPARLAMLTTTLPPSAGEKSAPRGTAASHTVATTTRSWAAASSLALEPGPRPERPSGPAARDDASGPCRRHGSRGPRRGGCSPAAPPRPARPARFRRAPRDPHAASHTARCRNGFRRCSRRRAGRAARRRGRCRVDEVLVAEAEHGRLLRTRGARTPGCRPGGRRGSPSAARPVSVSASTRTRMRTGGPPSSTSSGCVTSIAMIFGASSRRSRRPSRTTIASSAEQVAVLRHGLREHHHLDRRRGPRARTSP